MEGEAYACGLRQTTPHAISASSTTSVGQQWKLGTSASWISLVRFERIHCSKECGEQGIENEVPLRFGWRRQHKIFASHRRIVPKGGVSTARLRDDA